MIPAACLGCEHREDWTGCPERCEHAKQRLVHELRKQAAALQDTLSKCRQEDLDRVLACRVYEYVPSPVIERQREYQRRYVEKNKDKIKAYQREYYRAKKAREAGGEGKEYESESTVSGVQ